MSDLMYSLQLLFINLNIALLRKKTFFFEVIQLSRNIFELYRSGEINTYDIHALVLTLLRLPLYVRWILTYVPSTGVHVIPMLLVLLLWTYRYHIILIIHFLNATLLCHMRDAI
jgi:hypothetical protein